MENRKIDIIEINPEGLPEGTVRAIKIIDDLKILCDKEILEIIKQEKCIIENFKLKIKKVGKEIYSVYFKEI